MRIAGRWLNGVVAVEPDVHADARGFFLETFHREEFAKLGITTPFVQDNHSRSVRNTLRGLHFQANPGQAKLVRVVRGSILDVVVDLRRREPTFGRHVAIELDDARNWLLFVPVGFAHGFLVRSPVADVVYKVSSYYDPLEESGVAWDDPDLGINWGIARPLLSDRDRRLPTMTEVTSTLPA